MSRIILKGKITDNIVKECSLCEKCRFKNEKLAKRCFLFIKNGKCELYEDIPKKTIMESKMEKQGHKALF